MQNSRRQAAFAVARWLTTREFASEILPDGPDRAFVQDLVYTVVRRLRPLRKVLGELVKKWPKGELEALLYVGAAQILFMDDVPDFAAVNETVNAAKSSGNGSTPKVVNAVLRNLLRRRAQFEEMLKNAPLELRESFPGALARRWIARFGENDAAKLCAWHNEPAKTYLARPDGSFTELERGVKVFEVDGYDQGKFIVQDPGTKLAIGLMRPAAGDRILDVCAAPGGKSIQLAWRGAKVVACEVNPSRRRRLEQSLKRVRVEARIIGNLDELGGETFNKVLADVPCSNTGVLRRRVDARWNWSEERLSSLVSLQAEILDKAAARVSPGGTLVYSTCSNEPEENSLQVESFLRRNPAFTLLKSEESIPFESGCDGAYAAALVKNLV